MFHLGLNDPKIIGWLKKKTCHMEEHANCVRDIAFLKKSKKYTDLKLFKTLRFRQIHD